MPGAVALNHPSVSVAPGGEAHGEIKLRNTGPVVEQFTLTVLGPVADWAQVIPGSVSLFPNAEETIRITFRPPMGAQVAAGPSDYGVRVVGANLDDWSEVVEGTVNVLGVGGVEVNVVPRTAQGKQATKTRVRVRNAGNTVQRAQLRASDPDDILVFAFDPEDVEVDPGDTVEAELKIRSRKKPQGRGPTRRPYQVVAATGAGQKVVAEAAFEQKKGFSPLWIIAAAVIAAVAFLALQSQGQEAGLASMLSL